MERLKESAAASPSPGPQRRAAIAALVSTVLLFALLLGGTWLGVAVYEALPMGPFPKSRIVSSGVTVLVLLGGYIVWSRLVAPRLGRRTGRAGGRRESERGGSVGARRGTRDSGDTSRRRGRGGKGGSGGRSR
jgi:hypothetical protein